MSGREPIPIGTVRMSYTMQPVGLDGRWINGGNHYADANSSEDARGWAEKLMRKGTYLGHALSAVAVHGREMRLGHAAWVPIKGGRSESFQVTREDVGTPPVFLHSDRTHCYDTTVMDYFETVHAMKSDGSCQCGDPARNVRR